MPTTASFSDGLAAAEAALGRVGIERLTKLGLLHAMGRVSRLTDIGVAHVDASACCSPVIP